MTVNTASEMHFKARQCIAQPDTTLHDCTLYLTRCLYDPGILPGSAHQCALGNMYLGSELSRNDCVCSKTSLISGPDFDIAMPGVP